MQEESIGFKFMKSKYFNMISFVSATATLFFGSIAFAASPESHRSSATISDNEVPVLEVSAEAFGRNIMTVSEATVSQPSVTDAYFAREQVLTSAGADEALEEVLTDVEPAEEPATYWGYTNLGLASVENHLNVRAYPSEDGRLIGKMSNDAACEILDVSEDGWAHIISGEIEGYVSMDYLLTGPAAIARANQIITPIATVTTDSLKVREAPNTDCAVITMVPEGEELKVLQVLDGWIQIDLDDEDAFVSAEYVTVEEKLTTAITMTELLYGEGVSDVRVDLCQYAKQFVGNPYVWGGTSLTNGADCSGFVLSVYAKYGVTLPHSSRAQANCGTTVSLSAVKPGDLIFYTRGGTINHVAIYIGNGQVVHASSPSTGIRISSMYYRTPYKAVSLLYD